MGRKKTDVLEDVEPKVFIEKVKGKIPNKDAERLTEIRDKLFKFKQEFFDAKIHSYGLQDRIYFRWKNELDAIQQMFDTP